MQPHLKTEGLPIKGIDNLCCWENYQYALLCLNDDTFNEVLNILQNKEQNQKEIQKTEYQQTMNQQIKKTDDKILNELELAANSGRDEDIAALLDIFDKL